MIKVSFRVWPWLLSLLLAGESLLAAPATNQVPAVLNYAHPKLLTATIYQIGSHHQKVLFRFRRSATQSGDIIQVDRTFELPDGTPAAVEHIVYKSGKLAAYNMNDLQAGLWGSISVLNDPAHPDRKKLVISHGSDESAKSASHTQTLAPNTLIDDTVYPFILAHWRQLENGATEKFQFVSLGWDRTFGFEVFKTGTAKLDGQAVVRLKMQPSNFFIARMVKPIRFSIEQRAPHRLLEYIGRTTPRVKRGGSWKYLNADTVFHWPKQKPDSKVAS